MKNWLLGLASALLLVTGMVQAQEFEEGTHYEVISDAATSDAQILEFFSFYCVHCYRFEPIAERLKKEYPDSFEKMHVSFLSPKDDVGETMTKAFVVAQKLGIEEKIIPAVFDYNFAQRNMLTSEDDIRNVFILNGVSGEEFDKAMSSFAVRAAASKMDRKATDMDVRATPTFIVNGKYKMLPQGFRDSDDFAADFSKLAGYLLNKS